jgi:hypothetical protein
MYLVGLQPALDSKQPRHYYGGAVCFPLLGVSNGMAYGARTYNLLIHSPKKTRPL